MVRSLLESIQERRKKKELSRLFLPESGRFEKKKKEKNRRGKGKKDRRSFIQDGWKGCCSCLPPSQAVVSKDRRRRPERKRRNVGDEERGAPPSRSTACCCCPPGCWLPALRSASRPCWRAPVCLDTPRCSSSCCPPASSCSAAISRGRFGTRPKREPRIFRASFLSRRILSFSLFFSFFFSTKKIQDQ